MGLAEFERALRNQVCINHETERHRDSQRRTEMEMPGNMWPFCWSSSYSLLSVSSQMMIFVQNKMTESMRMTDQVGPISEQEWEQLLEWKNLK
jgi:hypothetical protein